MAKAVKTKPIDQTPINLDDATKKLVDDLKQELESKQQELNDALQNNASMQDEIEKLESALEKRHKQKTTTMVSNGPTIPSKSFKVDGVEYVFVHPKFNFNNKHITADQALTDNKLLAELVKIGFGGIKRKGE